MLNSIQTVSDLNKFIMSVGQVSPDKIISHLADKKLIVSFEMAKLITSKTNTRLIK